MYESAPVTAFDENMRQLESGLQAFKLIKAGQFSQMNWWTEKISCGFSITVLPILTII